MMVEIATVVDYRGKSTFSKSHSHAWDSGSGPCSVETSTVQRLEQKHIH